MQVVAAQKPESLEQSSDSWQNELCTLPYDTQQSRTGSKPLGINAALLRLLPLRPQLVFPITNHQNSQMRGEKNVKCCRKKCFFGQHLSDGAWSTHGYTSRAVSTYTSIFLAYFPTDITGSFARKIGIFHTQVTGSAITNNLAQNAFSSRVQLTARPGGSASLAYAPWARLKCDPVPNTLSWRFWMD